MRILVTGVTGQIGGALLSRLPASATTIAADRSVLDLAAPQAIPATLDRLAPDIILNPAAYTAVDKAEDEPALAMRVNGEAPGVIARWAAARGLPLIHFSTDYVFDGSGDRAWREDDARAAVVGVRRQQARRRERNPRRRRRLFDCAHLLGLCGYRQEFPAHHFRPGA